MYKRYENSTFYGLDISLDLEASPIFFFKISATLKNIVVYRITIIFVKWKLLRRISKNRYFSNEISAKDV